MKIVADENIPLVEYYFGTSGELLLKPGRHITRDDLFDADILLTRSVTRVNKLLLHDTPVKFVGSATAGADHLDIEWLNQAGIQWSIAAGCNADAVSEYVLCVIATLQKQGLLIQPSLRAGVVGVGHVGKRVAEKLAALGFEVVLCDPLRAMHEKDFPHVSLENFADLDLITLHTPLTKQGDFPTYRMIEKSFLQRQKKQAVLLNTARGEIISSEDLLLYGKHLHWCFDVWDNEPSINPDVLAAAMIATPHIAGYSRQAKIRGIDMIYQAAVNKHIIPATVPSAAYDELVLNTEDCHDWRDVLLKIYNPITNTMQMKNALSNQLETFDSLRKHFPERYELAFVLRSGGEA